MDAEEFANNLLSELGLQTPRDCDAKIALRTDIIRLLDTERLWTEACAIARIHCPVSVGESHIRQGIPRLAKKLSNAQNLAQSEYDRGRAEGRADVAKYSNAIGLIESVLGCTGARPLNETVETVKQLTLKSQINASKLNLVKSALKNEGCNCACDDLGVRIPCDKVDECLTCRILDVIGG